MFSLKIFRVMSLSSNLFSPYILSDEEIVYTFYFSSSQLKKYFYIYSTTVAQIKTTRGA
jgi:hypothetical protein